MEEGFHLMAILPSSPSFDTIFAMSFLLSCIAEIDAQPHPAASSVDRDDYAVCK